MTSNNPVNKPGRSKKAPKVVDPWKDAWKRARVTVIPVHGVFGPGKDVDGKPVQGDNQSSSTGTPKPKK